MSNEFLKKALGGSKAKKAPLDDIDITKIECAEPDEDTIGEAFKAGQRVAKRVMQDILEEASPFIEKGHLIEGSLVVFVAVWMSLNWAKGGVIKTRSIPGDNPVQKLWSIFEMAFSKDTPEEAEAVLRKWLKDNGQDVA